MRILGGGMPVTVVILGRDGAGESWFLKIMKMIYKSLNDLFFAALAATFKP